MKKRTAKEFESIIKICKQHGVEYFRAEDIELRFRAEENVVTQVPMTTISKDEKDDIMDEALQDLILTDPLAYEEALNHNER
jgi:hypothetical protein